jgi:integrase/recombinase XerD
MVRWHVGKEFDTTLDRYVRYLKAFGHRESTIERYRRLLAGFLKFAKASHPVTVMADEYRSHLIEEGQSASTINNASFAIAHFYKMHGEEWKAPKLPVHNAIPHFFTEEEVGRIFEAASYNIKHAAMFSLMLYACLRATELCLLEDRDLDLENLTVHVQSGKGDREAICLISPQCASTLRRYLEIRPKRLIDEKQYLFYTDYGHRWNRVELNAVFKKIKKRAGVDRPGSLHVWGRHTPCTLMVAHGANLAVVQAIMRHRSISTTMKYAHVADTTRRINYEKFLKL